LFFLAYLALFAVKLLRLPDKACSIGWFFKSIYDSLNAVFDEFHVPVYQKAKFDILEFHIGEELRHVDRMDFIHRFIFNNNLRWIRLFRVEKGSV